MNIENVFSVNRYEEFASNISAEIITIGYSEKNLPIKVLKKGTGKIKILFVARIHGNEPAPTQALLEFFNEIPPTEIELYGIFLANPDGATLYERLWIDNSEAHWTNNFNEARLNANGIDINRDWLDLSQKETQAIQKFIISLRPDFVVDQHEYYWSDKGYPPKVPTDDEDGFMSTMTDAPFFGVDHYVSELSEKAMYHLINKLENEFNWKIKPRHFTGKSNNEYENPSFLGIYLALRGIPKLLVETWGVACSTLLLNKRILFHKKALIHLVDWFENNKNLFANKSESIVSLEFCLKDKPQSKVNEFIKKLELHNIVFSLNSQKILTTKSFSMELGFIRTIYFITFNMESK